MRANVRIVGGKIRFASPLAEQRFMEKAERKYAFIEIDDLASAEKRRFFEGAVVPAVFYQLPHSGWANFKECREALKLEFLSRWTKSIGGERMRYAMSTTELSNLRFGEFINKVIQWMQEQQMGIPDPEEYKSWRDSAPGYGEVYPQVAAWKQAYDEAQ